MRQIKKYFKYLIFTIILFTADKIYSQSNYTDIFQPSGNYSIPHTQSAIFLSPVDASYYWPNIQWEQSIMPLDGFTAISGATASFLVYNIPLAQTTYFRRKTTDANGAMYYSNTVKMEQVSVNWENQNYVREHDVLVTGQTDWKVIDQLPIGQKLQTTTYMDGLGRQLEKVSRETATPVLETGTWGDMVQFSKYDALGREPLQYLPYTTATESGKFKSSPLTEQPQYYTSTLNENYAFSESSFDNSPLDRVTNVKSPGTSWHNASGNSVVYDLNETDDNVQSFTIGYNTGDAPVNLGSYPLHTLFKTQHLDENNKQAIEYTNKSGQVILTKTQIDDNPSAAHSGWICVYSIYDDFGLLRYRLQPEAVKYLDNNGWSFAGTNGQKVLNELCFRYEYDDKGRNILKKAPGAKELQMVYDNRDRIVFMQDGNQRLKPEWTANIYDELDRVIITTLYHTSKLVSDLQTDIASGGNNTITTNNTQPIIDLTINNRDVITFPNRYAAQNSIEFTDGFISPDNDAFVAEIDAAATQSNSVIASTYNNPISSADLNDPVKNTIVKYLFYDDYSFSSVKAFDNNFDNTTAYSNGDANVIPIAKSSRTTSFPTGSMVRVLGTNTFLSSTEYYDEKGRHIQSLEDNIKSGKDVTTMQYQWDGRLLSTNTKHTTANTGYNSFGILTKNIFDKIGRVTSLQKKYGGNDFKTIAAYDLDDMGRLKTKHLDPGYIGSGKNEMESLTYSYNIHNNITGINKNYALKTPGQYDKWANFFGLYLGYDNRDNVFNTYQLDGHVTGLLWNTMGDDTQRKYDYTYDNAGRLIKSDFKERQLPGGTWDNSKMDFTVGGSGTNSTILYDLNGNLQTMFQKGVVIGNLTPLTVDNLQYRYASYSNKLTKVTDNGNAGAANGKLGDFVDGTNSGDDYVYDDNGNLIIDLNKNATNVTGGVSTPLGTSGITYNFLDKPEQIHITGKGTIQIVYDADGNKRQKKYTPENTTNTTTTTYINEFVYQGDALQYINFEEGRIRAITPVSQSNGLDALSIDGNMLLPNNQKGAYDYFIRDYQQNVRMILTEEIHTGTNTCTMESNRAGNEEPIFGQTGTNNEVTQTRTDKPYGWQSNTSSSVSMLSASGQKAGPNVLLKVMAGDQISASTQTYYQTAVQNSTGNNLTNDVLTTLISSILGSNSTGLAKGNSINISTQLSGSLPFGSITAPDANNIIGSNPKAYMTIMFFDERFNYVGEGSTAVRVEEHAGDGASLLVIPAVKSPKNGYAYVYLSNESNEPVYFDNFVVNDNRGRIIEENHYYSYGLKIAAISSRKLPDINDGGIKNNNLYNDKELWDDADLNWYDYGFRNYDPQIGRFTQLDPLTDDYPELAPYQYASNDPIDNIDIDGLEGGLSTPGGFWNGSFLQQAGRASSGLGNLSTGANIALQGSNLALKISGRASADNTYIKNPIRALPRDISENGDKHHATIGPAQDVIRSKEQQAALDKISKNAEKNGLRKLRERNKAFDVPVLGDLFKTVSRIGHGDLQGSIEPGLNTCITILTIPAGGEGPVLETGFKSLTELGLKDGMEVSSSKSLELGEQFLGNGYKEVVPGSGRYISSDGTRVFRMGANDITGAHGGAPHVNFETLVPNPTKFGKMMVDKNLHIYIK